MQVFIDSNSELHVSEWEQGFCISFYEKMRKFYIKPIYTWIQILELRIK